VAVVHDRVGREDESRPGVALDSKATVAHELLRRCVALLGSGHQIIPAASWRHGLEVLPTQGYVMAADRVVVAAVVSLVVGSLVILAALLGVGDGYG
jgi:hypothetical protein